MSGLNYKIEHRSTKKHQNCDSLSRLPLPHEEDDSRLDTTSIYQIKVLEELPIDSAYIKRYTQTHPVLSKVYQFVQSGEWTDTKGEFTPYYRRREEISTQAEYLFWGSCVIIPPRLQKSVLDEIHETHMGIVKTKSLARSHFYFPGIDAQIEKMCRNCNNCVAHLKTPK